MAFSSTSVYSGTSSAAVTVTATADADTGGTVTHGIAVATPLGALLVPLLGASFYGGQDFVALPGATTVVYTKGTAVGSGNAAARALVWILLPHSLIR
jgi:hypothetical protein